MNKYKYFDRHLKDPLDKLEEIENNIEEKENNFKLWDEKMFKDTKVDQELYDRVVNFARGLSNDLDLWNKKVVPQDTKNKMKYLHIRVFKDYAVFGTKKEFKGEVSHYGGATVVWDNYRIAVTICSNNETFVKSEGRKRALERLETLYDTSVVVNHSGHVSNQYLISLPELKYPNSWFEASMLDYILRTIVPRITLEQYHKNVRESSKWKI